ncbi:MAG: serine hydrolase domain-containing protein [Pseudomonadota bacterium]
MAQDVPLEVEPAVPVIKSNGTDDQHLTHYVQGVVDALRFEYDQAGVSIAITDMSQPLLLDGYGWANTESGARVDADTLFQIGSVSKLFIWTSVMLLVDRGELDLDEYVNTYLSRVQVAEAFDTPVTMRHLMTHTAGFEDSIALFLFDLNDPRSRSEALAEIQPARVFAPGARTSYSNWGSELAAQVVADISGVEYEVFLQRELLDPLGMNSTSMTPPEQLPPELADRMSAGHRFVNGQFQLEAYLSQGPFGASGRIASSAEDMARWMRFHLNRGVLDGVRLMSAETHDRMWSMSFDHPQAAPGLAHGFMRRELHGEVLLGHGGSTRTFHTFLHLIPEQGIGVYVSSNTEDRPIGVTVAQRLVEYLTGMPEPSIFVRADDASLDVQPYVGDYLLNRRSFTTMTRASVRNPSLSVRSTDASPGILSVEYKIGRMRGNTQRYAALVDEPDVFETHNGQRIRFVREDDQVVAVNTPWGVHSHERVEGIHHPGTLNLIGGLTLLLSITTLLGAWRRWKHQPERTSAGKKAALAAVLSALAAIIYVVLLVMTLAAAADFRDYSAYPMPIVQVLSGFGWVIVIAALAMAAGTVLVWRKTDWGWWRRTHYSVYALLFIATTGLLWHDQFFGAPLA